MSKREPKPSIEIRHCRAEYLEIELARERLEEAANSLVAEAMKATAKLEAEVARLQDVLAPLVAQLGEPIVMGFDGSHRYLVPRHLLRAAEAAKGGGG